MCFRPQWLNLNLAQHTICVEGVSPAELGHRDQIARFGLSPLPCFDSEIVTRKQNWTCTLRKFTERLGNGAPRNDAVRWEFNDNRVFRDIWIWRNPPTKLWSEGFCHLRGIGQYVANDSRLKAH